MRLFFSFFSIAGLTFLFTSAGLSQQSAAVGEQRIAVIIADQPGIPFPHSSDEIRDMLFSKTNRSVDSYWREVSYGKTWATGDVFGPVLLDKTYDDDLTSQNQALASVLKTLGQSIDLTKYNHLVLAYPVPGYSAWVGHAGLGCVSQGCPQTNPPKVVYLGTPRTQMSGPAYFVILHELIHSLGTGHSQTVDFAPDAVGPQGAEGRSEASDPSDSAGNELTPMGGSAIFGHLEAPMKYQLGWLDKGSGVQDVETNGTFHLEPLETATGGLKSIRIRRAPGSDRWLWVEYRQPFGLDQAISSSNWSQVLSGALIYYEEPPFSYYDVPECAAGSRMCNSFYLTDMTADTTPHVFKDAALAADKSWSDPFGLVTISIGRATGSGLDVTVSYETPCATFSPSSRSHDVLAATADIDVTAPASCNWTASAYHNPNWLTIISGSGSRSGKVAYSVSGNDTYRARSGWITIARQTFAVSQTFEKVPPVGKRAEPNSGRTQAEGEPEMCFVYADKNGWNDIQRADVLFNTDESLSNACYVEYDRSTRVFRLGDDSGTGWAGPHHPDHPGNPNPENSYCTIRMAAPPGYNGDPAKEEFYTCLHILFKKTFAGTKNIYLKAMDSAGLDGGWTKVGTWTIYVNEAPQPVSVTPNSGSGASQIFTAVVSDVNGAIDIQTVWLQFTAANDSKMCRIRAQLSNPVRLYLSTDDGQSLLWGTSPGDPEARLNSFCGFSAAGVSVIRSGNDVTLTLPMMFTPKFSGAKDITVSALDVAGAITSKQMGTWTVPASPCTYTLSPGSLQADPYEMKGTFQMTTDTACSWLAGSTVSWMRVTSNGSGTGSATVSYTVFTNTTTSARTGSISIGGQSFSVSQAGRATVLPPPLFGPGGVLNAASMEPTRFVPSTWYAIQGTNLAPRPRLWQASDFNDNKLPTVLDGVWVSVNGKPGLIYYISPTQINFLAPDDDGQDAAVVRVYTPAGTTQYEIGMFKGSFAPAFFMFEPENSKYVASVHLDGVYLGKTGLYQGLNFRPAKPGDIVALYGTGFGETDPACPASELVNGAAPLRSAVTVKIGGKAAEVRYAGLVSSGLYQLNVVVPDLPNGDHLVAAEIGGVRSQVNASITVLDTAPPSTPQITSLVPSSGGIGQTITNFTVNGQNLSGVTAIELSPAAGIVVTNINSTATAVTAQVTLSPTASAGGRSLTVVSPAGRSNALTFTVTSPLPQLTSVSPSSGQQEQTVGVTITGANLTGVSAIEFSPSDGISVSGLSMTPTSITASVAIAYTAAVGDRSITVTGSGGRSNALSFTVTVNPVPKISGVNLGIPVESGSLATFSGRLSFTDHDGDIRYVAGGIGSAKVRHTVEGDALCTNDSMGSFLDKPGQTSGVLVWSYPGPWTRKLTSVRVSTTLYDAAGHASNTEWAQMANWYCLH